MAHSKHSRHVQREDPAAFAAGAPVSPPELPTASGEGQALKGSLGRITLVTWLIAFLALSLFLVWDLIRGLL